MVTTPSEFAGQITDSLGIDELTPMALGSWKDRVDQHECVQAGRASTHYNPVLGLVEVLFDLLAPLRAARRTFCSHSPTTELLGDDNAHTLFVQPAALPSIGRTSSPSLTPQRFPTNTGSSGNEQPDFDA